MKKITRTKVIYPSETTRVPSELLKEVRLAVEGRKDEEPGLRQSDVWFELIGKVRKK